MSKINDFILQCEESNDKRLEKYKQEQDKMLELHEEWNGIYPKTQYKHVKARPKGGVEQ